MNLEKIILDYDKMTGSVYDKNGMLVGTVIGLVPFDDTASVDNLVKLKNAGFTADEIIELKCKEVI